MIISIASGKGGTGKTTVAVNLALSLNNVQLLDCDVEEPNAHIFLKPVMPAKEPVYVPVPEVDKEKCNLCGVCREVCEYKAIAVMPPADGVDGSVLIFSNLCHGCGACSLLCRRKAIKEVNKEIGIIESGTSGDIKFVHGKLDIGQILAPFLIREVKKRIDSRRTALIDAPPGTSCPAIAAVKGSDYCILVTEPTPFGLNDLILALEVLQKLKIPFGVIINRFDIGDDKVDKYCRANKIPVLMRIPFDREIAFLYSRGIPMVEVKAEYGEKFREMFKTITKTAI